MQFSVSNVCTAGDVIPHKGHWQGGCEGESAGGLMYLFNYSDQYQIFYSMYYKIALS